MSSSGSSIFHWRSSANNPTSRRGDAPEALQRQITNYKPLHTFKLEKTRPYQQQYADIYFLRLTKIRPAVEAAASVAWEGTVLGGEKVKRVERVLDVRQGELCWVAGTVYMDMPLKPSILEDVSKDVSFNLSFAGHQAANMKL